MPVNFLKFGVFLTLSFLITSCTSLSSKECKEMNWSDLGNRSALKGETLGGAITDFKQKCESEHSVQVNIESFKQGFSNGLKVFCSPDFSKKFAADGGVYQGNCPPELKSGVAFEKGRLEFLEARSVSLESEIQTKESSCNSRIFGLQSELTACRAGQPTTCYPNY